MFSLKNTIQTSCRFNLQKYPAFFLFLALCSGAALAKGFFFSMLLCFIAKKRSHQFGFVFLAIFTSCCFVFFSKTPPPSIDQASCYLQPKKIHQKGNRRFLQCTLYFINEDYAPTKVTIPLKKNHREFNKHFFVEGKLKKTPYGYYFFIKKAHAVPFTYSFCALSRKLKLQAQEIIKQHTNDPLIRSYFNALVTADYHHPFLKNSFATAGIIHTLVISGFHFSWMIFLFSIPLCVLLKKRLAYIALLLISFCYYFFLGSSSSILRAWIGISFFLIARFNNKQSHMLNTLGVCGILACIFAPSCIYTLSFALSFLSTFSILCLYPLCSEWTNKLVSKRERKILMLFSFHEKCIYYFNRFVLTSFSLTFCIQLTLFPILLPFFPYFPLWSFFFNAFFPVTMIFTIILLLFSFTLHPFINTAFLWKVNEIYSSTFLYFVVYGKGNFPLLVKVSEVSMHFLELVVVCVIYFSLATEKYYSEKYLYF